MGSTMSLAQDKSSASLYHEKQSQELCALHALNNLFQEKGKFFKKDLDEVCRRLSPDTYINPHKSILGLGNYDVNVVMSALDSANYQTIWFDKRKDLQTMNLEYVFGFILNIPSNIKFGIVQLPIQRKHWIAVRQVGGKFYNFDSKLDEPELIGADNELLDYLEEEVKHAEKQLLIIVEKSVSMDLLWNTGDNSGETSLKDSGISSQNGSDESPDTT